MHAIAHLPVLDIGSHRGHHACRPRPQGVRVERRHVLALVGRPEDAQLRIPNLFRERQCAAVYVKFGAMLNPADQRVYQHLAVARLAVGVFGVIDPARLGDDEF
jgi:hypothetical protein